MIYCQTFSLCKHDLSNTHVHLQMSDNNTIDPSYLRRINTVFLSVHDKI